MTYEECRLVANRFVEVRKEMKTRGNEVADLILQEMQGSGIPAFERKVEKIRFDFDDDSQPNYNFIKMKLYRSWAHYDIMWVKTPLLFIEDREERAAEIVRSLIYEYCLEE